MIRIFGYSQEGGTAHTPEESIHTNYGVKMPPTLCDPEAWRGWMTAFWEYELERSSLIFFSLFFHPPLTYASNFLPHFCSNR